MGLGLMLVGVLFAGVCSTFALMTGAGVLWAALIYVLAGILGMMGALALLLWRSEQQTAASVAVTSSVTFAP